MKKYVLVFIAGILLVPAAIYLYLRSGYAPVSTSASPLPFERFFAKLAMHATLSHEAPKAVEGPPTEADMEAGANLYRENCAVCHGLPNALQTGISKGMYPHPPQFFRPDQPTTYDASRPFRPLNPKSYWKVKNGVRLTGMPGFKGSLTEQQIRQVSDFVSNARNLPPAALAVLESKAGPPESAASVTTPRQPKISN
jgi:mono/diheme cytochrome c family protein